MCQNPYYGLWKSDQQSSLQRDSSLSVYSSSITENTEI